MKQNCVICKKEFNVSPSTLARANVRYCSYSCRLLGNGGKENTCEECGKVFRVPACKIQKGYGKFCSRKCFGDSQKSSKAIGEWHGKTLYIGGQGYVRIVHGRDNEELFHRYYAREFLQWDIEGKVIHHIDGNRQNNMPENLMLVGNDKEHQYEHAKARLKAMGQDIATHKYCPKCKEVKTRDFFGSAKGTYDGLYGFCKQCACDYQKSIRDGNPEEYRRKRKERYDKKNTLGRL